MCIMIMARPALSDLNQVMIARDYIYTHAKDFEIFGRQKGDMSNGVVILSVCSSTLHAPHLY